MRSFKGFYCTEDVNCNYICCVDYGKVNPKIGYRYLIGQGSVNFALRAFCTSEGFKQFLKVYNVKMSKTFEFHSSFNGDYRCYTLKTKYKVCDFWHLYDLPKNVKKFIDLCNGSYVECYYADIEGQRVIFKPNPNAKEVYKPLDYIYYSKLLG